MKIKYMQDIILDEVPIQWITRFELFVPDLPNFPMIYVHLFDGVKRIFGFPIHVGFTDIKNGKCKPRVKFLSNVDLNAEQESKKLVVSELSERFGIANKVTKQDIMDACGGDERYREFFSEIWDGVVKPEYGNCIPYGRYFEEFYSIVRFSAAWNTAMRGGRQQELRQLYWFLREYGKKIEIDIPDIGFYRFFLLPTYTEIKSKKLSDFPRMDKLLKTIKKIWDLDFGHELTIGGKGIRSMGEGGSWPMKKIEFVSYLKNKHVDGGNLTLEESYELGLLVDMFDRFPRRAVGFIWSVMSIDSMNYESLQKNFIDTFYLKSVQDKKIVGIYPKVIACFLQQGFGNEDAIPVDEWVLSFVNHPLGIFGVRDKPDETKIYQKNWELEEFFGKFDKRAKLERFIWYVSQLKKVNMEPVFDMVWCIRYGTSGEHPHLREQNPIACYQCSLRDCCSGYSKIEDEMVWIHSGDINDDVKNRAKDENCNFICSVYDGVPKKITRQNKSPIPNDWILIDEFSGFRMKPEYTTSLTGVHTVKDLMADLTKHLFTSGSER